MPKPSLSQRSSAPELTRAELLSVLRHPTRVHCISVLTDRVASPKELAAELRLRSAPCPLPPEAARSGGHG